MTPYGPPASTQAAPQGSRVVAPPAGGSGALRGEPGHDRGTCPACLEHSVDEEHCSSHGYEPVPIGAYRICVECGHCYITREDLETLHYALLLTFEGLDWEGFVAKPAPACDIHTCPLCTHDF